MKCTNCGKNNAVYHYHFNLNGQEQEAHLCPACAGKLQPEREFAAKSREMFGDMFDDGFFGGFPDQRSFGGGLLNSFFGGDPFEGLFGGSLSPFALLGAPRIEISFPETERGETGTGKAEGGKRAEVDPELAARRELNALRARMEEAVKNEEFEKAAQLRDRIRAMESGKKNAE